MIITKNDRNHDDHDIMIPFCCSIVADDHDSIFLVAVVLQVPNPKVLFFKLG